MDTKLREQVAAAGEQLAALTAERDALEAASSSASATVESPRLEAAHLQAAFAGLETKRVRAFAENALRSDARA